MFNNSVRGDTILMNYYFLLINFYNNNSHFVCHTASEMICSKLIVNFQAITKDLVATWTSEIDLSKPFDVYESTKHFALLLNLRLYLGLDHTMEPQLVQQFSSVASTHWHGKVFMNS